MPAPPRSPIVATAVPTAGAPHLVEDGDTLTLHFDPSQIQSRMLRADPHRLVLPYTRTMAGFVLLAPTPARIAMIGLGGGSLARWCRHALPDADFTAIELSPQVVALRDALGVPPDGPRFRVHLGDGAAYVRTPGDPLDVLLVDGFDPAGQPPDLCSPAFYAACAARLAPPGGRGDGGLLVVNLNAETTGYGSYARRIRDAFGGRLVVVESSDSQNKIVFAGTGPAFARAFDGLAARADALEPTLDLGLPETAAKLLAGRRRRG